MSVFLVRMSCSVQARPFAVKSMTTRLLQTDSERKRAGDRDSETEVKRQRRRERVKEQALIRLHIMYASPYFLSAPLLLRIL